MFKGIVTGLGGRGLHWMRQARQHPQVELVAYVEPHEPNRQRAAAEHGVPANLIFNSLADAIAGSEADFLIDVTPPAVHHVVAEQAFAAGLHVLGEKPLSDDFEIARRVATLGAQSGLVHMITQNYRFGPQPRTTRKLLAEGLIGKPGQCDVRFYMPWADAPGSHYVLQPFMLINDMMVHHFDLLRYILAADPVDVQAITWNQPWGWHAGDAAHAIVFRYADGMVATHVSCGCAVGSQTTYNGDWRIEGDKGSIDWTKAGMKYWHLHRTAEKIEREIEPLDVPPSEKAMLDEFFAAISQKREPECSARDNLASLAMVFGAIKSSKEGRRVELAELTGS